MFVARIIAAVGSLAIGPLALVLLVVAETSRGRLFAVATLLTALLPWFAIATWSKRTRTRIACLLGCGAAWLGAGVWTLASVPPGTGGKSPARVCHVFSEPGATFPRYALSNWLPEGDQLLLGLELVPLVDPILTRASAAELKRLTASIYRELESDEEFHVLGSMMSDAYGSLRNPARRSVHAFVYVPAGVDRAKPAPVLVFFHGSAGNFKAYTWLFSKLADRLGFVLVTPSGGFGNWSPETSGDAYERAMAAASRITAIDRSQIHVVGLSNGGLALSQLAAARGREFASMTFLSTVFDEAEIGSGAFAAQCRGRRMLVVTGLKDDRVPPDHVMVNASRMRKAGADVTVRLLDHADHFLLFSHRAEVLAMMEQWLIKADAAN